VLHPEGNWHDQRARRSAEKQPQEPVKEPVVAAAHDDPGEDSRCQAARKTARTSVRDMMNHLCPWSHQDWNHTRCEAAQRRYPDRCAGDRHADRLTLGQLARTLVLDGPRRLRLSEHPSRLLRPGEIRLRARLSGISHGTELSLYRGISAFTDKVFDRGLRAFVAPHAGSAATYPVMLGYEMASEVVEVAPDVTEVGFRRRSSPPGPSPRAGARRCLDRG
jgi:hypothetical protein